MVAMMLLARRMNWARRGDLFAKPIDRQIEQMNGRREVSLPDTVR